MADAPQAFIRRVKDRATPEERKVISFFIQTEDENENGETVVVRRDDFTASYPTQEQMLWMFAQGGRADANIADQTAAMFEVFKEVLPADQYRVLISRFKDPNDPDVDAETVSDIFEWLMERWQDFPTQQPSGSSTSQGSSGTSSTGRSRGKGSIR